MKKFVLGTLLWVSLCSQVVAQKKEKVLFTIDKQPTYVAEFKKLFPLKKSAITTSSFEDNLQLMVAYKLKLIQAKKEGIDTLPALQKELKNYKKDLAAPFFTDTKILDKLLKEAYERSLKSVRVSHILLPSKGKDTLAVYRTLDTIKAKLAKGASFENLALQYSKDPSVTTNKGDLGYFSVFSMVYPFETGAYQTPLNQVSNVVKTSYGYHLIKVNDVIEHHEKIKVAHIMIRGNQESSHQKIDSIYQLLSSGTPFKDLVKQYSEDLQSAKNNGALKPFTRGVYPINFEEVAYSLSLEYPYSEPLKTPFGWHILKYIGKEPLQSFEEAKESLKKQILRDVRGQKAKEIAYQNLINKLQVNVHEDALQIFKTDSVYKIPTDSLQQLLFTIKNKKIYQSDFAKYIQKRVTKNPIRYFDKYKKEQVENYLVEHLEEESKESKEVITTYKNGLVIFELMKKHVWDVPNQDPEKVKAYYQENISQYQDKGESFEKVKGFVESDYQDKVQQEWIESLKKAHLVKFNKRQVKKLRRAYQ